MSHLQKSCLIRTHYIGFIMQRETFIAYNDCIIHELKVKTTKTTTFWNTLGERATGYILSHELKDLSISKVLIDLDFPPSN
jgi:hypothetical protein